MSPRRPRPAFRPVLDCLPTRELLTVFAPPTIRIDCPPPPIESSPTMPSDSPGCPYSMITPTSTL